MSVILVGLALVGFGLLGVLLGWALEAVDEERGGTPVSQTEQGQSEAIEAQNDHGYGSITDRSSATKTRAGARARDPYSAKNTNLTPTRRRQRDDLGARLLRASIEGPRERR